MATLTATSTFFKKFIVGFVVFLVLILISFVVFMVGKNLKNSIFPSSGRPAFVAFDKIPKINFTEGTVPLAGMTFKVETISGQLEELQTQAKVFGIKAPVPSFGDLGDSNELAMRAGFTVPPIHVTTEKAVYLDGQDKTKTLEKELISGNIFINSDYLNNPEVLRSQPRSEDQAKGQAVAILTRLNPDTSFFPPDKMEAVKLRADGDNLIEAVSLSQANIVQVNFYRSDIDKIPVVYPNYKKPKVRILVTDLGVVAAKVSVSNIQLHKFSTYPLKGVKAAFEDLKKGEAILNKNPESLDFPIRKVSLGYLDFDAYQPFLQPVYVFESDGGINAFVSAVDKKWILGSQP